MPPVRPATTAVSRTALIVDDFPSVRAYHSLILRQAGFECREAANGREALAMLGERPVDVVVLDLGMPEMNGQQFVEHLHANPDWAGIAVLVITAERGGEHIPRSATVRTGPVGLVRKPIFPAAILAELANLRWRDTTPAPAAP